MAHESLQRQLTSGGVEETIEIGRRLGAILAAGDVVALIGALGAGKTQLVKGVAAGLGVHDTRRVSSPTFVIVHEYEGSVRLFHVDAYRLRGAAELEAVGFEEFAGRGAVIVEWAENVRPVLPTDRLDVVMELTGETDRLLTLRAGGPVSGRLIEGLANPAR